MQQIQLSEKLATKYLNYLKTKQSFIADKVKKLIAIRAENRFSIKRSISEGKAVKDIEDSIADTIHHLYTSFYSDVCSDKLGSFLLDTSPFKHERFELRYKYWRGQFDAMHARLAKFENNDKFKTIYVEEHLTFITDMYISAGSDALIDNPTPN